MLTVAVSPTEGLSPATAVSSAGCSGETLIGVYVTVSNAVLSIPTSLSGAVSVIMAWAGNVAGCCDLLGTVRVVTGGSVSASVM